MPVDRKRRRGARTVADDVRLPRVPPLVGPVPAREPHHLHARGHSLQQCPRAGGCAPSAVAPGPDPGGHPHRRCGPRVPLPFVAARPERDPRPAEPPCATDPVGRHPADARHQLRVRPRSMAVRARPLLRGVLHDRHEHPARSPGRAGGGGRRHGRLLPRPVPPGPIAPRGSGWLGPDHDPPAGDGSSGHVHRSSGAGRRVRAVALAAPGGRPGPRPRRGHRRRGRRASSGDGRPGCSELRPLRQGQHQWPGPGDRLRVLAVDLLLHRVAGARALPEPAGPRVQALLAGVGDRLPDVSASPPRSSSTPNPSAATPYVTPRRGTSSPTPSRTTSTARRTSMAAGQGRPTSSRPTSMAARSCCSSSASSWGP